MISTTVMFGAFCRPNLSVTFTIGLFLVGKSIDGLKFFADKSDGAFNYYLFEALNYVVPNFTRFDWKNYAGTDLFISGTDFAWSLLYFAGWFVMLQVITAFIFRRREFA